MIEGAAVGGLVTLLKSIVDLATGTKKNKEEIEKLRAELKEVSEKLLVVTLELQHQKEKAEKEKELLLLEIDNRILKAQKQPPRK